MDKENYSYKKIEFYAIFCFYEQDWNYSLNSEKFKYLLWYDKGEGRK